jgi:hypothetical protein
VQHYAGAPVTSKWVGGTVVLGDLALLKGTAIATFTKGVYASKVTGNHAALYISQDANGIWVMDQWAGDLNKPKVSKRYIKKKGKNADGTFPDPSNNADAFSVIE